MGILEDVVLNSKVAVECVGKKTGEVIDLSKLKLNLIDINSQLQKLFQDLGLMTYQAKSKGEDLPDVDSIVKEITELREEAGVIKEKMDSIKNVAKCPVCSTKHAKNAVYCSKCGAKLVNDEE